MLEQTDVVDSHFTRYMNHLFAEGHRSWKGQKLLAAIMFTSHQLGKGSTARLPRSMRSLKGWQSASPSRSRRPLALAVWVGFAAELFRIGAPLAGVLVMVMVECYLRPGEMLSLTPQSFLAPTQHGVDHWVVHLFPEHLVERSKVGRGGRHTPPWTHDARRG